MTKIALLFWTVTIILAGQAVQDDPLKDGRPGITVLVQDNHGLAVRSADIEVKDKNGITVLTGSVTDGRFEILDLGFGPHSIVVGKDRCAEVELKNVYFHMDTHQTLRIIRNDCPYSGATAGSGCFLFFRVKNVESKPLSNASIRGKRTQQTLQTDHYGRASAILGANTSEMFAIEAYGYVPATVPVACGMMGTVNKEVTLSRK